MQMGIPHIDPYPMPREDELPAGPAGWRPDPARAMLLVHDMQQYFLRPFTADASPAAELVSNIAALLAACRRLGVPVAYTAQPGDMSDRDRGLLKDVWGSGMDATPEQRAIVPPLEPAGSDLVLTKWRYSAFHRTSLLADMRRAGRDQLVICGVYAHVGCLMTACDAFSHDIEPFLVADATADFDARYHRLALDYAAERCARVASTRGVLEQLGAAAVAR